VFGADGNFSAFSYEKFYPEISGAPDDATRRALIQQRWDRDIARWGPAWPPLTTWPSTGLGAGRSTTRIA